MSNVNNEQQPNITQFVEPEGYSENIANYQNMQPQVSNSYRFFTGVGEPFNTGIVHNLIFAGKVAALKAGADTSDQLTPEEIETYKDQNPGLKFDNGISRSVADALVADYQQKQQYEYLNNTAEGFWANLSTGGGHVVGNLLEPASLAVGALATPEFNALMVGDAAATTLTRLAAVRAAQGAIFNASATTAEEASEYLKDKVTGQDYNPVQGMAHIGASSVMGAALFGTGSLGFNAIKRSIAAKYSENFKNIQDDILNNATNAYSNLAKAAKTSKNALIRNAGQKMEYWNTELESSNSRKPKIMQRLLDPMQEEIDTNPEGVSPEVQDQLKKTKDAHADFTMAHVDAHLNLKSSPRLKHEEAMNILQEHSPISKADDTSIQKIAINQMLQGKDVDVEAPVKQAFYEQAGALRDRLQNAGIDPQLVADSVDETRTNFDTRINELKSKLEENNKKIIAEQKDTTAFYKKEQLNQDVLRLKKQLAKLNKTEEIYKNNKISFNRQGTARLAQQFEEMELDPNIISDLAKDKTDSFYESIEKIGSKLKSAKSQLEQFRDLEDLQNYDHTLRDHINLIEQEVGNLEYMSKALRDTIEPPTGVDVKDYMQRTVTNQKNILGKEVQNIDNDEGLQTYEEREQELNNINLDDLKRPGKEHEAFNEEIEAGKEKAAKADRRLGKLTSLIKDAIDCVMGGGQ